MNRARSIARIAPWFVLAALAATACSQETSDATSTAEASSTAPSHRSVSRPIGAPRPASSAPAASPTNSTAYQGGAIISPAIHRIYWGSFSQSEIDAAESYLNGLAGYMWLGSSAPAGQEPNLFQYGVFGASLGGEYADTSLPNHNGVRGHAVEADVRAEIAALQSQGKIPGYSDEGLFLVMTKGISFDDNYAGAVNGWCGYHNSISRGQYYALNPFPYASSCGSNGYGGFDATAIWQSQISHEVFEAATDPNYQGTKGWFQEIGDGCNWGDAADNTVKMSFGAIQKTVDKLQNACSTFTRQQISNVTATSWSHDRLDLVGLGTDRAYYHKAWTGNGWQSTWESLGGAFVGAPAVVAWGPNRLDVVGQGLDGAYYHKAFTGDGWQSDWESLGGAFFGPPTVTSWGSNRLDVIGQGLDGAYYHKAFVGSGWQVDWESLGGAFIGQAAATSWSAERLDVVGVGLDGAVYHKAYTSGAWQADWESLGGTFISKPAAVSWSTNRLDIVGQGTDGAYYHKAFTGDSWQSDWESLSGAFMGAPTLVSWGANRLDIVGQGMDSGYYHKAWLGDAWQSDWESIGGGFVSAPAAASWSSDRLDIVGVGLDQAAYHQAWTGDSWQANWELIGGSLH